jgi:hypothetical protein
MKEEIKGEIRELTKEEKIRQQKDWVDFLKTRLKTEGIRESMSEKDYKKMQLRYDKAKLQLKFLKDG